MIVKHNIINLSKFIIIANSNMIIAGVMVMNLKYQNEYTKLGLNIAYYRKLNKYTQLQLCELLDIDRTHISKIELGNVGVSLDILFSLSEILKVPVSKFFEFKE